MTIGVPARTIVIGDIQGCLAEFDDLLRAVEYRRGVDRLILAGDLLDRGPDSVGVVRRAMEIGAESVTGNHEESHLRFRENERLRVTTGRKNNMKERAPGSPHRVVYDSLGEAEWAWLEKLPNYLHIDDKWTVVHAGCLPGIAVEDQHPKTLHRLRYVNRATGKMASLGTVMRASTHAHWTELWTGPKSLVYGHYADKQGAALSVEGMTFHMWSGDVINFRDDRVRTVGIDTGCCYGHKLSAAIFVEGSYQVRIAQVQARGKWAELYEDKMEGED